jgi:GntR family transcriptional regulator
MIERTKTRARLDRSDALSAIVDAFKDAQQAGLPKVAQLYNSISQLIASGKIREGTKLPGERELCAALNLSLGTAQKSLTLLMNDGELSRHHGRGTFVRASRRPLRELWHYRFRESNSQSILPVYAKVIDRAIVEPEPTLVAALGADPMGYVRVSRLINIADRFFCWSEIFLGATRFRRLLKLKISDVETVNLKQLLDKEFNAPTLAVSQTAKIVITDKNVSRPLRIAQRSPCLLLQIVATSRRREPITFQKIFVPPVEYELELIGSPFDTAGLLAA